MNAIGDGFMCIEYCMVLSIYIIIVKDNLFFNIKENVILNRKLLYLPMTDSVKFRKYY